MEVIGREVGTRFEDIKEGEVFQASNSVYIKTEEFENSNYDDYNAVRLTDGSIEAFENHEEVIPFRNARVLLIPSN